MKFRSVLGLCVGLTVVWCGAWFFAQHKTKDVLQTWVEARQSEGWTTPRGGFEVTGFPNRLDVSASPWQLDDPQAGWAWQAPFLKMYTLVYNPGHVIARFAQQQQVFYTDTANQLHEVQVTSDPLEASIIFNDILANKPILEQLNVAGEGMVFTNPEAGEIRVSDVQLHLRQSVDVLPSKGQYDLVTKLNGLELPENFWKEIDPDKKLGNLEQTFETDLQLTFAQPLDTKLFEGTAPTIRKIDVADIVFEIGALKIKGHGTLELAPEGWPVGELDLVASGWKEALSVAEASGLLSDNDVVVAAMALNFLAGKDKKNIKAPLSFKRGRVFLGPIPIGQAPVISKAAAPQQQ